MATNRKIGASVTVWSHATNATQVARTAVLNSATVAVDNDTEDGAGAVASWSESVPLRGNYTVSCEEFCTDVNAYDFLHLAAAAAPTAIITFQTGGGNYVGTAAIRSCRLEVTRGLQKMSTELVGIGALAAA